MAKSKPNSKKAADPYAFRYRLLASVDVVSSSEIKNRSSEDGTDWVIAFRDFFGDFPAKLAASYDHLRQTLKGCAYFPKCTFQTWKLVGDEILFHVTLANHKEASIHCIALLDALAAFSAENANASGKPALRLKAAIWGAGFPVTNVELMSPSRRPVDALPDFLGPSIDLGFRLAAIAEGRKVPVSADLAWLLMKASHEKALLNRLSLSYDGMRVLKGVNASNPYPIFWIDRRAGQETAEDRLLGPVRKANPTDVILLLEEFFAASHSCMRKPFIEQDGDPEFSTIPKDIAKRRTAMMADDPDWAYASAEREAEDGRRPSKAVLREIEAVVVALSSATKRRKPKRNRKRSSKRPTGSSSRRRPP